MDSNSNVFGGFDGKPVDTDGDGIGDNSDLDIDGNGINDDIEILINSNKQNYNNIVGGRVKSYMYFFDLY